MRQFNLPFPRCSWISGSTIKTDTTEVRIKDYLCRHIVDKVHLGHPNLNFVSIKR